MARDYAKTRRAGTERKKSPAPRKKAKRKGKSPDTGGFRIFFAGLLSGVFLCSLAYLATLSGNNATQPTPVSSTQSTEAPEPSYEFYTMLSEQTFEVEVDAPPRAVEPAADVTTPARETYLLQAGSFRLLEDADRRRAELIFLGLEPNIQESETDNGLWHRVYLGPFTSRGEASHARSLTAEQGIDTLLLKRGG